MVVRWSDGNRLPYSTDPSSSADEAALDTAPEQQRWTASPSGRTTLSRQQQQQRLDYDYIKQRIKEVQRAALAGENDYEPGMPSTDNDASSVRADGGAGAGALSLSNDKTSMGSLTMRDPSLALLLPLLILLSTLLFLLVFFLVFLIVVRRRRGRGIALQDHEGPLDLSREEEFEGEGGIAGVEERWLEQQDEAVQRGYERAKRELNRFECSARLFNADQDILPSYSMATTIPTQLNGHRHHTLPIPEHTRKRRISLVIRARLRIQQWSYCYLTHRNNILGRWNWNDSARRWGLLRAKQLAFTQIE